MRVYVFADGCGVVRTYVLPYPRVSSGASVQMTGYTHGLVLKV